jgi:spore coat protein H
MILTKTIWMQLVPASTLSARRWGFMLALALAGLPRAHGAERSDLPVRPSDLFQGTQVWTIHLTFTADQWRAMEPAGGGEVMGGGPGIGPFGGRRPGEFGPAMFLAPGFLKGDSDQDGVLSKKEFLALGESWFGNWDKAKQGQLDQEQIGAGLNTLLPQFGGPGSNRGPGGPPGPPLQASEGHRNGLAGAAGIDFNYVHADMEFDGHLLRDVAVRYKGNGTYMESRNSAKRSLKLDLNKYVKGQKIAGVTRLNLHNNVTDASWMNEVLSHRLFRDAGVPAPRTAYAKVFVTVPGTHDKEYFGLYSIVEDVDSHFAKDRFGSKDGAIFKPVTRDLFSYLGDDWSKYEHTYDPKTELSRGEQNRVIDFSKLVTSGSDSEFSQRLVEYLDIEEFARFMSVTVWLSTLDSILMMGQNFYVYLHPETHKFEFVPWDLDHSFGQFPMGGTQEEREQLSILKPWRGSNRFLERVFNTQTFKKVYLATMKEFSNTIFAPERFSQQVDELAASIRPAVKQESEVKLARFDKAVQGESVDRFGPGGGPGRGMRPGGGGQDRGRFGPGGGFGQAAKPIKAFVTARAASVAEQLSGKSEGAVSSETGGGPRGDHFIGRGPGGPDGPGGFGPGMFLARRVIESFDADKNGKVSHAEFTAGFAKWFSDWNNDGSGKLSDEQLRNGINRDLAPHFGGPPGGPGFGPPPEEQ